MFGTFNLAASIFSLVIPETKGVALERMDVLFGAMGDEEGHAPVEETPNGKKE